MNKKKLTQTNKRSTCLLQKVYYYQKMLLLQEVNYKKQGWKKTIWAKFTKSKEKSKCERKVPKRNLQQARKKAREKEKP